MKKCQVYKCILKFSVFFLLMVLILVASLTLVYSIPEDWLEWHYEYSEYILHQVEGTWESCGNLFGVDMMPGRPDRTTDQIMFDKVMVDDDSLSALEAAMDMNNYTRYWHGYQVFLRPLLIKYQIHQIRYLSMSVFFSVFVITLFALRKKIGVLSTAAFFVSMICAHIVVIPMSFQFIAAFLTSMIAMLIILWGYPFSKAENLPLFFMCVGMVINFLDLLTVPIITLCFPLLLCLCIDAQRQPNPKEGLCKTITCSLAWTFGYAGCWGTKWVLSSMILKNDIISQAMKQAKYWSGARGDSPGRLESLIQVFRDYFLHQGVRTMLLPLLLGVVVVVLLILFRRKYCNTIANVLPLLMVSIYPYIWYMVLNEHTYEHHWFVYRAQAATLFGAYLAFISLIDQEKAECAMKRMLQKPKNKTAAESK